MKCFEKKMSYPQFLKYTILNYQQLAIFLT